MADPRPKSPLWMRIALVASLALNLGVIGIFGGALLRGRDDLPRNIGPGSEFRMLSESMPGDHRRALRRAIMAQRGYVRAQRQSVMERRAGMMALLRAPEFDADAFAALMSAQQSSWTELGNRGQALILDRVAAMTPAERSALADAMAKWPTRRQRPPNGQPPDRDGK